MGQLEGLTEIAFDRFTLINALAIYVLLRVVAKTPLGKAPLYRRFLPFLPEGLGVVSSLLGGIPIVSDQPVVIRVAIGLWCGYLSQRSHKILGQTILGDDPRIAERVISRSKLCQYCGGDRFDAGRCATCGAAAPARAVPEEVSADGDVRDLEG